MTSQGAAKEVVTSTDDEREAALRAKRITPRETVRSVAWLGPSHPPGSAGAQVSASSIDALQAVWPHLEIRVLDEFDRDFLRSDHPNRSHRLINDADATVVDLRMAEPTDRWLFDLPTRHRCAVVTGSWQSPYIEGLARRVPSGHNRFPILVNLLPGEVSGSPRHNWSRVPVPIPLLAAAPARLQRPMTAGASPMTTGARPAYTTGGGAAGSPSWLTPAGRVVVLARGNAVATVEELARVAPLFSDMPIWFEIVCNHREREATIAALMRHPWLIAEITALDETTLVVPPHVGLGDTGDGAHPIRAIVVAEQPGPPTDIQVLTIQATGVPVGRRAVGRTTQSTTSVVPQESRSMAAMILDLLESPSAGMKAAAARDSVRADHDPVRTGLELRYLIGAAAGQKSFAGIAETLARSSTGNHWIPRWHRNSVNDVAREMSGLAPAKRESADGLEAMHERVRSGPGLLILSAPKSGTHLAINLARALGWAATQHADLILRRESPVGLGPLVVNSRESDTNRPIREIAALLKSMTPGRMLWAHSGPDAVLLELMRANGIRSIHIVRDPRAVILSLANWYADPAANHRWRTKLMHRSLEERIDVAAGLADWMPDARRIWDRWGHYAQWAEIDHVVTVRFEDLVGTAGGGDDAVRDETIRSAACALGVQIDDDEVLAVAASLFGGTGTFRHGQIDRWREVLSDAQVRKIEDSFAPLMERFGYQLVT